MSVRIRVTDLRAVGVCPAVRHWFARHDLDWRAFLRDGIAIEDLRATNDMQDVIDRLEAIAMKREAGHVGR